MAWLLKTEMRSRVTGICWRLAFLLLPWQTRVFVDGPSVAGLPWEQGRWSFYVSWIPLIATIACAAWDAVFQNDARSHRFMDRNGRSDPHEGKENSFLLEEPGILPRNFRLGWISTFVRMTMKQGIRVKDSRRWLAAAGLLALAIPSFFTESARATLQWWMAVTILALFGWALLRLHVSGRSVAYWFVLSLVPHAMLGVFQFYFQKSAGSVWLGMASQNPLTPGVSVIELAGRRVLRAYGGFPHPNIFGAWLAVAIPCAIVLRKRILSIFFSSVLVLTFSRSAWIAIALGLLGIFIWMMCQRSNHRRTFFITGALVLLTLVAMAFSVREVIAPRFVAESRLEKMSMDERWQSLQEGWSSFLARPFVGTGPGAYLFANESRIPPHHAALLALTEFGLIGMIGLYLLALWFFLGRSLQANPWVYASWPAILSLAFFDHYVWSLWSGVSLGFLVFFMGMLPDRAALDTEA